MTDLFGGLTVQATCRDCGQAMTVLDTCETVHPCCTPKPTAVETLAVDWLSATVEGAQIEATRLEDMIEDIDSRPPPLAAAAIRYASFGWPVFPLKAGCNFCRRCTPKNPCGKHPYISKRKGGNGFKDATSDVNRIKAWWTRHPTCNIGLATGAMFDVLDVDVPAGIPSFLKLVADKRIPDVYGLASTASGGLHVYLKPTGKGNAKGFLPGLDYRAIGGYVVAPPSTLGPRWRSYRWLTVPSPHIKGAGYAF